MRKCRNWQTSKTKDLVLIASVWVQVLIHWTDNPTTAESAANEILDKLTDVHGYTAGGHTVGFLSCSEAHNAGRDERGICEYVIDVTVYYERSN